MNSMRFKITAALVAATCLIAACQPTTQNQTALGAVFGGVTGLALSDLLDANPQWTAVAVIGGAAAGTMLAQNRATRECAYADGRGGYFVAPCR
jgi:Na+/H+ antiporter NhaC